MPSADPEKLRQGRCCHAVLFLVLLLTAVVFLPSLNHDFVNWDDDAYVLANPSIRQLNSQSLKEIFTSFVVGNYQPLTVLSFAVEYHFFRLSPGIYHLVNVALHLLNVFLVYGLLRLLTGRREVALLTALLFGIHPLRVESVAWVTERKDVLFAFFYLLSLHAYLGYLKSERPGRKLLFLTGGFFVLSLLAKPAAVTLPLALLLLDHYHARPFGKPLLEEKLPFFFLSVFFSLIAFYGNATPFDPQFLNPESYSFLQRIFLTAFSLFLYSGNFLLPVHLSAFYPYPAMDHGLWPLIVYLSGFIILAVIAAGWKFRDRLRGKKEIIFGSLFFFLTISVNLPVLPVGHTIIADRFTYLPSVGLSLLAARGCFYMYRNMAQSAPGRAVFMVAIIAVVAGLAALTWQRVAVWENSATLWSDVIAKYPKTALAYYNRGGFYVQNGYVNLALEDYNRAIGINPYYYAAHNNRGNMRFLKGDEEGALSDYNKALELNPHYVAAYSNRAAYYIIRKNYQQAIAEYQQILSIEPDNETARTSKQELEQKLLSAAGGNVR